MLKENTSEYAYLFSMVMKGVEEGAGSDRLFLLPNAARRLLEVFCSFKVPDRPNFDDQLKELVGGDTGTEPYRDVYDFCQRRSHGEGAEVVDVLDGRAVHDQLKRCMAFLKERDDDHYNRMCKAVGCNPALA
ncbi:AAA family ATPase [uncultured Jatrophihabitans sp.]|uniref:AAA family ATPase n=1 Tax=uncultured Jatrophihabitans sp. TaxID=1610747 RepID=UPI0035CBDACB